MDHELKVGMPALRCACTWRSSKWRIAPDNMPVALRLIEVLWTEEPSDWSPLAILWDHDRIMDVWRQAWAPLGEQDRAERGRNVAHAQAAYTSPEYRLQDEVLLSEPWRKVATAIEAGSQLHLERSLAEAQAAYSPLDYSILIQGFKKYLVVHPAMKL